ncbi:MAG: leucine-rich repeat protein [Planctomycetales bacterium]|nr:leucine-rich repeat protein [Planctomycetales bacterium]
MTATQAVEHLRALGAQIQAIPPENADHIQLQNCKYTDADVHCFAAFPRLIGLTFDGVPATRKTFLHLRHCRNLEYLRLYRLDIEDEDFAELAEVTTLKRLSVEQIPVTARCVEHLKGLENLESIFLPQSVDNRALPYLVNFPKLKSYHPFPSRVTDEDMQSIGQLRSLEHLNLQIADLSLEGYKQLANLTEIKSITLPSQAPPGVMGYLTKMKLESLYFPDSATIGELKLFQGMTTLRYLRPSSSIDDEGLKIVAGFSTIDQLNLMDASGITDAGLVNLLEMKSVKQITLPHQIGDDGLVQLARNQNLEDVSISVVAKVTPRGLQALASLPKLSRVRLPRSIDDQGLEAFTQCRQLKAVMLPETPLTPKGYQKLQKMKKLEYLNLEQADISAQRLEVLKSLKWLKSLTLVQCKLSPADGDALKAALRGVQVNIH